MPIKRKAVSNKAQPTILADGSAVLRLGIVADAMCSCVHISPSTLQLLRFNPGDYLQIDDEERCTQIVRKLADKDAPCECITELLPNYLYMDRHSAYYLDSDLHAALRVKPAEYPLESP